MGPVLFYFTIFFNDLTLALVGKFNLIQSNIKKI